MNPELIALVFMDDDTDNFFIENPPKGPIETWIGAFANTPNVEYVDIVVRGDRVRSWSNPNASPES